MGYYFSVVRKPLLNMLAKTGLLVCSNPKQIGNIMGSIKKEVKHTLYIQFLSALGDPLGNFCPKTFNTWPKFSPTIYGIYSQAATNCNDLDVRVLLSGLKYNIPKIQTQKPIDLIIFDKPYSSSEIDCFINMRLQNLAKEYNIITLNCEEFQEEEKEIILSDTKVNHTVLGGTFDRLHLAHKLLLSEAALRADKTVTVGVTEENMLFSKTLWEFIEDTDLRINNVRDFLCDICPELNYNIVPISDPFGPAITDPTMELIVVSQETFKGGEKINLIRRERNLPPLDILPVELVDEPNPNPLEEAKISSSTTRMRLLGTVLKPIQKNSNIPNIPYVIGLTGGIASGKSGVTKHMQNLGAEIINCDLIGHECYKPGKLCYKELVKVFGEQIVADNGEIDRKVLGTIVFKNKDDLEKLNNIVWPYIAAEVQNIIKSSHAKVIVVEAAVLLVAGWQNMCHEVWTTIIPREEAVKRLIERNLAPEHANNRINAQPNNKYYIQHSNVVLCSLWPVEYTKEQVKKAWDLLLKRMPS
ncbi:unnamed protein product [Psylliodes chrysocephalus]|uniref:Bifunctional coenzyme A synthase n=1 Tax=Psylliodes chrysocephalus TaxID=3402493 RepID=A0A9P0GC25_9CUCU|nr:unnamed protein product [Psylliodes chrysocephala]